jgi:DHA2 family multidrug resistance protein
MLLGVGLPLIFVPILAASYDGIPRDKTDQASALLNAARNTGGSIGVSLASNVLAFREPPRRAGHPVEHLVSGHAAAGDPLFRRPGQLHIAGCAASGRLDRPAESRPRHRSSAMLTCSGP